MWEWPQKLQKRKFWYVVSSGDILKIKSRGFLDHLGMSMRKEERSQE